jgi:hypothetical protein
MHRIALVPLDERPVTTRLPRQVAAVAGVDVLLPPPEALPRKRGPGDLDRLRAWLIEAAEGVDAAVVALDTLGQGGLIPSRIGAADELTIAARWEPLARLRIPVHASIVILRTPDADDADEEPDYFADHGRAIHAWSASLHRGHPEPGQIPVPVKSDVLGRRLRHHVLNLHAVQLAHRNVLDSLAIGADDSAVWGVGSLELQWLRNWIDWLDLGGRVRGYAGADEIGTTQVARAITATEPAAVRVAVLAADTDRLRLVPRYESRPLADTITDHLAACGAVPAVDRTTADLILVVHPPEDGRKDLAIEPPEHLDDEAARRSAALITELVDQGHAVAVADCGLSNGAHDTLIQELRSRLGDWDRLAGYAGWNTAGNTVGTAVAAGVTYVVAQRQGRFDPAAHAQLLRHRLLEDWGWMARERGRIRAELGTDRTRHDHVPPDSRVIADAETRLADRLHDLDPGWQLVPGSVRLPWDRTAEIDFRLQPH